MNEHIKQTLNKYKFQLLYLIAIIPIVYGGFAGNLIAFVLGVLMFVWVALLRVKYPDTEEEDEEDEMEVNDNNESTTG